MRLSMQIESETSGKQGARFRILRFGIDSICKSSIGEFWAMQARIWLILGWFLVFCVFSRGLAEFFDIQYLRRYGRCSWMWIMGREGVEEVVNLMLHTFYSVYGWDGSRGGGWWQGVKWQFWGVGN